MSTSTIARIDQEIDAVRSELNARETIDQLSATSWQAAWDMHPELRAQEQALFVQREATQQEIREAEWMAEKKERQAARKVTKQLAKRKRPVIRVTPAHTPLAKQWPHDSTLVEITDNMNGCKLEISKLGSSLMVRLYDPTGNIHLCAPTVGRLYGECIWSNHTVEST